MDKTQLFEFCKEWLSAWTGNQPDKLIEYYSEDAVYVDPEHRKGLQGRKEILAYFEELLDVYEEWVWEPIEVFPTEKGVVVKWQCSIPVGSETLLEIGVDIVELDGNKIIRNEVYFDRTRLKEAVETQRRQQKLIL